MKFLYNLGILIYKCTIYIASSFNEKASLWIKGRKGWGEKLKNKVIPGEKYIWVHCASLGEFEQGRPVIEAIKKDKPDYKIILTFFSPSGYEIRKDFKNADIISYLPSDTPGNAKKFIEIVNPALAIFVKYEFWNNYLSVLGNRKIRLILISGIFRKEQIFFKWYGSFFRRMLKYFTHIFVQDQSSFDLLKGIGIENVTLAGDTRFDRVVEIAGNAKDIPQLEQFRGSEKLLLAGSSWRPDEDILAKYINQYPDRMKWVFAPHEIDNQNIERLTKLINVKCVRFSEYSEKSSDARVLIIDNIGMLSSAYRYANISVIGGGFGKGIHNILEPACWGIPVLFGPNHIRFKEAVDLLNLGAAKSYSDFSSFESFLNELLENENTCKSAALSAGKYVKDNTGATAIIMKSVC